MKRYLYIIGIALLSSFMFQGCAPSLEFELDGDQIDIDEALNSPENVQALLNATYDNFANVMSGDIQRLHELLGDNLDEPPTSAGSIEYTVYNRGTFSFRTAGGTLIDLYRIIYRSNILRENSARFGDELDPTKLDAEAAMLRGWAHWEAVKLWAQPYGYTPDNSHPGVAIRLESGYDVKLRSTVKEVYEQIIIDLKEAAANLPESNGVYFNKDAAEALLAKVYFTMNDFDNALIHANNVLNTAKYTLTDSISRFSPTPNSEVIFGTISTGAFDNRAGMFTGPYRSDKNDNPPYKSSKDLYNLLKDTADSRSAWVEIVDDGLPTEFVKIHRFDKDFAGVPLLHMADIMLIRAESILESNGDKKIAADDLNAIRERAFGTDAQNVTENTITLSDVRTERRKELAWEGDRTTNLKRMGAKGENITIRGASWDCPGMVLQFPASEKTEGFVFNEEGGCN